MSGLRHEPIRKVRQYQTRPPRSTPLGLHPIRPFPLFPTPPSASFPPFRTTGRGRSLCAGSVDESGPCNIGLFRWKLIDCLPLPFTSKFLHDDDDERGLFRNRTAVIDRMLCPYTLYVCTYMMTWAKFYFGLHYDRNVLRRI